MHVDLLETRNDDQVVVGSWHLDKNGHAVAQGHAAMFPPEWQVYEMGTAEVVAPDEGERYLRALPGALSGQSLRALFVP
jgi:hypothetical protein